MDINYKGNIVDIFNRNIFFGKIFFRDNIITKIEKISSEKLNSEYIIPGFIDAHVHIESSMLIPENFGRLIASKGTVAIVTDPHEIANVMGIQGIKFMLENSKNSPVKMNFTIPSCVPATEMDASGAKINAKQTKKLADTGDFIGLSEMMNVPGVLNDNKEVLEKIKSCRDLDLVIDGHAPLISGDDLKKYVDAGISTDHECSNLDEAKEKLKMGMKIIIREGCASRNYSALRELISEYPDKIMFCTDDAHCTDILERGHIDKIVKYAVNDGYDLFDVLKAASYNAISHYKLDVGCLRVGDKADFIIVNNVKDFDVKKTIIEGKEIFFSEKGNISRTLERGDLNRFNHELISLFDLKKKVNGQIPVIGIIDGELFTKKVDYTPREDFENFESDLNNDILKIVYVNRYSNSKPVVAYCKGIGLKKGAFASTVSHDSHNIIAVGTNDLDICEAINIIIEHKGGLSCSEESQRSILPLPVGGLMSPYGANVVADKHEKIEKKVKSMGCNLFSPFMTLSFMALLVIPEIKIGEKGLFYNWNFIK